MEKLFSSCENCSSSHDGLYGSGRFCSSKCARGFSTKKNRAETSKKVSQSLKGKDSPLKGRRWSFSPEAKERHLRGMRKWHADRKGRPFDELGATFRRTIIFEEQNGRCAECNGLPIHNSKPLTFQLDHKDGDRSNNSRPNLQLLCPNCHTQTENWGSKNSKGDARARMLAGKKLVPLTGFEPATSAFGEQCSSN